MNRIRVCLIGCGRAGMIHARSYAGSAGGAELAAVCDPMKENLDAARQELNVPLLYTDYREAMANPGIDAVIVVTPTQFHREIVVAAAQALQLIQLLLFVLMAKTFI